MKSLISNYIVIGTSVKAVLFGSYLYIYQEYCIYGLPWNYTSTWIIAALSYDFFYYWLHRYVIMIGITIINITGITYSPSFEYEL